MRGIILQIASLLIQGHLRKMIKSLVTGGAGFIGSHLVDYLITLGHEVTVIDNLSQGNKLSDFGRKHSKLIIGDIMDADIIDKACKGCDYIYHLAALLGVEVVAKIMSRL